MASITIRNIDDSVKQALRVLAAENGRSMEEQARQFLADCVAQSKKVRQANSDEAPAKRLNLAEFIDQAMREAGGGVELEPFPRAPLDLKRLQKKLGIRPASKRS